MAVPQVAAAAEGDEAAGDNDVNTADDSLSSDLDSNSMAATRLSFKSSRVRAAAEAAAAVNVAFGRRLRVYVYDLPREFNYGMVELFSRNRDIAIPDGVDPPPYPAHQHSGEWWLLRDLLKPEHERRNSPAVRVTDPSDADVFFVPVFSSLSLVVNPLGLVRNYQLRADAWDDKAMQERLMDWLERQEPWRRSRGRDHVIPAQDPNSLFTVLTRLRRAMLLVSDFGRVAAWQANLMKDVVVPYVHRVSTYSPKDEDDDRRRGVHGNRTTLLFFMGNRYRKDGGAVRDALFKSLEQEADMILREGTPTVEGRRATRAGMRTSQFCLHPAGDTPSACRMFDAIVNLCVPVVVSDDIELPFEDVLDYRDDIELPFEDVLDYREFAVFVPTVKAVRKGYLGKLLRGRKMQSRLPAMQQRLREVRHFFEWDAEDGTVNQVWRRVAAKLPAIREMIHRERRMVRGGLSNCSMVCAARSIDVNTSSTGSGGSGAGGAGGGNGNSTSSGNGSDAMTSSTQAETAVPSLSAPATALPASSTLSSLSSPSSGYDVGSVSAPSVSAPSNSFLSSFSMKTRVSNQSSSNGEVGDGGGDDGGDGGGDGAGDASEDSSSVEEE
ncbi:unnamed protein product [Closterium sp. Naga37s-1]|nr:unnamed protein product [Closterium sp. Naga37s-1]